MALPDLEYRPSVSPQTSSVPTVALHVEAALLGPETLIRRGRGFAVLAAMHMPEASVNKQNGFRARKYQIGLAGQILHMQTVAETHAVQQSSDTHLGLRVASPNMGHVEATDLCCVDVGHSNPTISRPIASITLGTTALPNWR
jgi:hypothetical protein